MEGVMERVWDKGQAGGVTTLSCHPPIWRRGCVNGKNQQEPHTSSCSSVLSHWTQIWEHVSFTALFFRSCHFSFWFLTAFLPMKWLTTALLQFFIILFLLIEKSVKQHGCKECLCKSTHHFRSHHKLILLSVSQTLQIRDWKWSEFAILFHVYTKLLILMRLLH